MQINANERQVGGTHYRAPIQHWDWVISNGLDYLRGQASKYITRAHKKNGKQDLEKATHYVDKLLSAEAAHLLDALPPMGGIRTEDFAEANELHLMELAMLRGLVSNWREDVLLVRRMLQEAVHAYPRHWLEGDATPGYVNQDRPPAAYPEDLAQTDFHIDR